MEVVAITAAAAAAMARVFIVLFDDKIGKYLLGGIFQLQITRHSDF